MDLVHEAKRVVVMIEHLAKDGSFKIVDCCSLPYTGRGLVDKVITDMVVIDLSPDGPVLRAGPRCNAERGTLGD